MYSIGIIQARGGSKRIPKKNIKKLNGIPLIEYCIPPCLNSNLDYLMVSTDDSEIAAISKACGADVPFVRPQNLSEDVASELVTIHGVEWFLANHSQVPNVVVTIQPTTPFITSEYINACLWELQRDPNITSCITVQESTEPVEWMFHEDKDGKASKLISGALNGSIGVSQNLLKRYIPNGAVYATRTNTLLEQKTIISDSLRMVKMPLERSIDIDEPVDWHVAEAIGKCFNFFPEEKKR
ncbi:acylneuraminate cytidylyltransferase family protein [Alphaproteobacteria bacterium]|nr:acylneuraminate cytidylyltransferase family protein [Alphaproteobacteria bacterium]